MNVYDLMSQYRVAKCTVRDAIRQGKLEPWGLRYEGRVRQVAVSALPGLLEAMWDFVLYECSSIARGSQGRGPWVPAIYVSSWLKTKLESLEEGDGFTGKISRGEMAMLMGTTERRLWDWLEIRAEISYRVLEDALWAYGCMHPEDICPRDRMYISKLPTPGAGRKKRVKHGN